MFGIFKKSMDWGQLEFLFKMAACDVVRQNGGATLAQLESTLDLWLSKGNYKLTPDQKQVVGLGQLVIARSPDLQAMLDKCHNSDGSINDRAFAKVSEELNGGFVFFRNQPTVGDIQASLRASMNKSQEGASSKTSQDPPPRRSAPTVVSKAKIVPYRPERFETEVRAKPSVTNAPLDELIEFANQGDRSAQFSLGVRYENGDGVAMDCTEAARWYRRAADQNHADAQFNLALLLEGGIGVRQDYAAAALWRRIAANGGDPKSAEDTVLLNQLKAPITPNVAARSSQTDTSTSPSTSGSNASHRIDPTDPKILFERGVRYETGQGVKPDPAEAARLFRLAAEKGHSNAQFSLSLLYRKGLGVDQNLAEANKWFARSMSKPGSTD